MNTSRAALYEIRSQKITNKETLKNISQKLLIRKCGNAGKYSQEASCKFKRNQNCGDDVRKQRNH